jgi:diaminopimelate decarboxylase
MTTAATPKIDRYPAYVYDLPALRDHMARIRQHLTGIEIYYAAKANPDVELLRVLHDYVDGFEVSSGGELAHVQAHFPDKPLALSGPGKTDAELASQGVTRLHVESIGELQRLIDSGRSADILLRVNLALPIEGASLTMGGGATPFGMDPDTVNEAMTLLSAQDAVRVHGIHAHLASGLDAPHMLKLAAEILTYARSHGFSEINLGGGMAVSYADPDQRFDWQTYGEGLRELRQPGEILRIEPGRSISVYCGEYVVQVIDVKRVHGESFAIVTGGTHHIRTPATKNHDQPVVITGKDEGEPVTLVGQLCTPKDTLSRRVPINVKPGDVVRFAMAGAYAWNISHHDFLMHPHPEFHYIR